MGIRFVAFVAWFLMLQGLVYGVSEDRLQEILEGEILDFYESQLEFGEFLGEKGVPIIYAKHEVKDEKGAIIISGGRTEYIKKYAELIYDLKDLGFSIYIMDYRGQGYSGRVLEDTQKGYVETFDYYVADFKKFMDGVVNSSHHRHRFILAHSMGGVVASLFAIQYPFEAEGLILCAPMIEINFGPVVKNIAHLLAETMNFFGLGESYVPFQGRFNPQKTFEGNNLTHSKERFRVNRNYVINEPDLALGGATYRWLLEAMKSGKAVMDKASDIQIPVLLLQAGEDAIIAPEAIDEFCRKTVHCQRVNLTGAFHEILMEKDAIRDQALEEIRKFLARHTQPE